MNKFFKKVFFSRSFLTAMLIILQLLFYFLVGNVLYAYSNIIQNIAFALCLILSIYILGLKNGNLSVKLPWVILILLFPVFGSLFYFFFRNQRVRKKVRLNIESQEYSINKILYDSDEIYENLKNKDKSVYNQSKYILSTTNMPIYNNTESVYFATGEEYFESLLEELQKAEKFIFIEYFIIKQGLMWNKVFNILKKKAKKGVDIRVIYDDFGCINTLPQKYKKHIEKYGIKCEVFNPIYPIATFAHNNRDHRKVVVIDGIVGFTGGINLSDEYINKWERFGYWKDTGIMIKGEAVKSFTLMFLEIWHIYRDKNEDYRVFLPKLNIIKKPSKIKKRKFLKRKNESDEESKIINEEKNHFEMTFPEIKNEFVQPYMTTPMETEEIVARNVYVNILNSAQNYVYITTPYLILDPELESAVINAAKRFVDVRIITPRIPDKKFVFSVTRSNYADLMKAGVKIYEYVPGFIHAKNVVCDDKVATIGSINFDNRSFYHSYENGVLLYNSETVIKIRKDFIKAINLSEKIKNDYETKIPLSKRIKASAFKLLSPLL